MAKYNKMQVLSAMKETGMVPVFYHEDIETAKAVAKACHEGGVRAFEFTNRGDFAHEVFGELVKFANRELPGMIIGVGSVVDPGHPARGEFRGGTSFQSRHCPSMQPQAHPLLSGMRQRIGNRRGAGTRLRPVQGIPGRCPRTGLRQRPQGSYAMEPDNGHGRSQADEGES